MNVLKINGVPIQNPSSLQWGQQDLDREEGSGRNQEGDMYRDRASTKVKLTLNFPPMHDHEISALLKAVEDEFFELEYPDAKLGRRNTITAYVGDRTAPLYIYDPINNEWIWQGLSMNFTEK